MPIPATSMWRAGDPVERTALKRNNSGLVFALPYRDTYAMDPVLGELLDMLEPHAQVIAETAARFRLGREISFGVYTTGEMPAAWFAAGTLRRLANLGADLDIDIILIE